MLASKPRLWYMLESVTHLADLFSQIIVLPRYDLSENPTLHVVHVPRGRHSAAGAIGDRDYPATAL